MRMHGAWLSAAAWFATTSGCVSDLDEEPQFGRLVEQCEMATPSGIESQPAPFALEFSDGPAFLFGETRLAEPDAANRSQRDNTFARVTDIDGACSGELEYTQDASNAPLQVIALNDEERALNTGSEDRIVLWPVGGFVFEERAVVYYDKVLLKGGNYFEGTPIGTGVCTMEPGEACVRAVPALFDDEPTLLWHWPTPSWGNGAVLARDGNAYLYSCERVGDFDNRCRVARVDPARATDPSAYEYLRSGGDWGDDVRDAVTEIHDQTSMSTTFSDFTESYITVAARLLDENIELRRAESPSGTWSDPITLFEAVKPSSWFVGDVRAHPGLAEENNHLVITFHSNTEEGTGNHLAIVRLGTLLKGTGR